jgi:hypothetical protein
VWQLCNTEPLGQSGIYLFDLSQLTILSGVGMDVVALLHTNGVGITFALFRGYS